MSWIAPSVAPSIEMAITARACVHELAPSCARQRARRPPSRSTHHLHPTPRAALRDMEDGAKAVIAALVIISVAVWLFVGLVELSRWPSRRCCRIQWLGGVFEPCPCTDRPLPLAGPGGLPTYNEPLLGGESFRPSRRASEVPGQPAVAKPWQEVELPADLWQASSLGLDPLTNALVLAAYRFACLLFVAYIWFDGLVRNPRFDDSFPNNLESFTMQNYTLLFLYFTAASGWSVAGVLSQRRAQRPVALGAPTHQSFRIRLARATYILFEVIVVNAILLDLLFWALLWDWGGSSSPFDSLSNLSVHFLNAVMLLVELFLNRQRASPFSARPLQRLHYRGCTF